MARGLTTAVNNELASDQINPVLLFNLDIGSGITQTDHYKDLTYNGVTYSASSLFLGISDVTESPEVAVDSLVVSFSGADQTIIALLLNNNYSEANTTIYKGFLDSNQNLIANPFILFKGRVESFELSENENSSQININIASHWADFEKIQGRKTNTGSQQIYFSGDKGFDFASQSVGNIQWGKK